MKASKLTLLTMACAWTAMIPYPVQAQNADYLILDVPAESPGPPWYADFDRNFIPTDGEWVSIVFWRPPASVPEDFNLLDGFDIPRAWSAPLLFEGEEWWVEPPLTPGNLRRGHMRNAVAVPVYFVTLAELEANIPDDVLTLSELEAFDSLRVGYANNVYYDNRGDFYENTGFGNNRSFYIANGTLEGGGQFQVRMFGVQSDPLADSASFDVVIVFTESP